MTTQLLVFPRRYGDGIYEGSEPEAMLGSIHDLKIALTTSWSTDAHFVCYHTIGEKHHPRLNQGVEIPIREAGGDVICPTLALDYDNPGHAEWTEEWKIEFADKLLKAAKNYPPADQWTACYLTLGGARLVYDLTEPVTVETFSQHILGLIKGFSEQGIEFDKRCKDWTRFFRLPYVVRDGIETATYVEMLYQEEAKLDPGTIQLVGEAYSRSSTSSRSNLNLPLPDPDSTRLLRESGICEKMARYLVGTESYGPIFRFEPIAKPGARNSTIHQMVGQTIRRLMFVDGFSPEVLYALFYRSVEQLEEEKDDLPWLIVLWRAILSIWGKEESKKQIKRAEEEILEQGARGILQNIREKMRAWSDAPQLSDETAQGDEWIKQRLIFATSSGHAYLMGSSGEIHKTPVLSTNMIPPLVKQLGLDQVIDLYSVDSQAQKRLSVNEIYLKHAVQLDAIEYHSSPKGTYVGDLHTRSPRLYVQLYQLKDNLEAKYNSYVDEFFHELAGTHYMRFCQWIGLALDVPGGPICALSISGPPGIGKKLLVQGMAECFTNETVATGRVFTRFNEQLFETPIIHINEGFPTANLMAAIPDMLRQLIGGDPIPAEKKFHHTVLIRSPHRIIMTANNSELLYSILKGQDLAQYDRDAMAARIWHIDCDGAARDWLIKKGGKAFTRGWITGDSGQESQYVMARHMMWLYENRPIKVGGRFLMEGDLGKRLDKIATQSGNAPEVIETLLTMIETPGAVKGLSFDKDAIWVTSSGIVDFARSRNTFNTKLNVRIVGSVLKSLLDPASPDYVTKRIDQATKQIVRAIWHKLNIVSLLDEALEAGYQHKRLYDVVCGLLGKDAVDAAMGGS